MSTLMLMFMVFFFFFLFWINEILPFSYDSDLLNLYYWSTFFIWISQQQMLLLLM